MSAPVLSILPGKFAAGTTVEYERALSDYSSADGWALKLYLAGPGAVIAPVVGAPVAGRSTWNVALTAAVTSKLLPGMYRWREIVTLSGKSYVAASGEVVVEANIAIARAGDFQTFAEKMLAAVEAVIAGRIPADVERYQIAGRQLDRVAMKELWAERARLKAEIEAERNPGQFGRNIAGRFTEE